MGRDFWEARLLMGVGAGTPTLGVEQRRRKGGRLHLGLRVSLDVSCWMQEWASTWLTNI